MISATTNETQFNDTSNNTNNNTNSIKIIKFEAQHLKECGLLAAKAFFNDPGFNYMFEKYSNKNEKKLEMMTYFWERYLWRSVHYNEQSFIAIDESNNSKIIGLACPSYPTDPTPNLWSDLRAGLLMFPVKIGLKTTNKILKTDNVITALEKKEAWGKLGLKKETTVKVEQVAVHPEYQGKGIGSMLMKHLVNDIKEKGWDSFLVTQNPNNIPFYGKSGYSLVAETLVEPEIGEKSPPVYLLALKKE
ncbi:hypothetical protein ABK040_016147 [Willaertia magna]